MRAIAVLTLTAAGLAALVTTASAAELGQPYEGCARGQQWNGTRCEWAQPPVAQARPYYQAPQAYEQDDEDEYVAEAPPVYAAPQVYSYSYAVPYYRSPVVSYYAYARPRYSWGYGSYAYGGWGGHHHWRH